MEILCLGLNHTTAPVEIREKLAFSEEDARAMLVRLSHELYQVREMVILSTCNRIELYATVSTVDFDALEAFLAQAHGLSHQAFRAYVYRYTGAQAIRHLYRVATGLDSLVIGEPQILGQVTRALELALGTCACGAVLSRLFRSAIHAGKRTHAETAISRNPSSVSALAASLVAKEVNNLPGAQIVVIGAGEMAELAVEALRKRGATRILVVNRTLERAQQVAARWQAQGLTFEQLDACLLQADIVISSTSAPHSIIDAAHLEKIMRQRAGLTMVIVDIAVPRDVDARAAFIPGIKLYDIDSLEQQVESLLAEREAEVPLVEAILAEEEAHFIEYLITLDMVPIIAGLRKQAEAIRQTELEKTLRRMSNLTADECQRIDAMSRALVKKLLEHPTQRLRAEAACPQASEYATVARTLFGLPGEQGLCAFTQEKCHLAHPNSSQQPAFIPIHQVG